MKKLDDIPSTSPYKKKGQQRMHYLRQTALQIVDFIHPEPPYEELQDLLTVVPVSSAEPESVEEDVGSFCICSEGRN